MEGGGEGLQAVGLLRPGNTNLASLTGKPRAVVRVLMGPSVLCSSALFDHGVHVLGTMLVNDPQGLIEYLRRGGTTARKMKPDLIRQVNWASPPRFLEDS